MVSIKRDPALKGPNWQRQPPLDWKAFEGTTDRGLAPDDFSNASAHLQSEAPSYRKTSIVVILPVVLRGRVVASRRYSRESENPRGKLSLLLDKLREHPLT